MRAIVYSRAGDPDVLQLVERPVPEPGAGEVRVRVHVAGVNPTDWKFRRREPDGEIVPGQDGSGLVDAVGEGVTGLPDGQRVWVYLAQWQRPGGTAQERLVLPRRNVVPLPDGASFELGASLGVPAMTAHRALTVSDGGPDRLAPGALEGQTVLVAGGAGAVGNAAIQLARWAGATVVATVSGPRKAALAQAAGANHVVNYRKDDAAGAIQRVAPHGVDIVVEVAAAVNAGLNAAVLADHGTVAVYGAEGGDELVLSTVDLFRRNIRYQGFILYTTPDAAKEHAAADINAAVAAGALRVGEEAGLPLHRYPLEKAAEAHAAVESGAVGKVLIDLA